MNDMERRKIEDSFQDAFKDAEVNPSDNVWTNVELDLERAEGEKMKRRLFFFQTLAAASITFALCVAGIGYYLFNENGPKSLVSQEIQSRQSVEESQKNNGAPLDKNKIEKAQQENSKLPADIKSKEDLADQPAKSLDGSNQQSIQRASEDLNSEKKSAGDKSSVYQDFELSNDKKIAAADLKDEDQFTVEPHTVNTPNGSKNLTSSGQGANGVESLSRSSSDPRANLPLNESDLANNSNAETIVDFPTGNSEADKDKAASFDATLSDVFETKTNKLPSFYAPKSPVLQLPVTKADPGALLLARLADEERAYRIADKKKANGESEKLWTSVGFAAGGFNSPNPSVSPAANLSTMANSSNVAAKQSKASGLAYSVGFSVGANLSDRWVLQGGVNYLTQSSDYTANNVIVTDNSFQQLQAESINAYNHPKLGDGSQSRVAQTFPYKVNNNVQFVSVPVQAGYLVLNKKFGVQVNAGVSTDLFLQNTITPDGGGLTKTTQSRGDDSPYRSLNFSGLMGTELSYRLGSRYRLSLNPGLRYPLNSVYKSDTGVQATPLTFDVGLRFRYIFH